MKRKKPKNKDDEVFRLEEENRELKALNRSLLRELKKRNRGIYRIDDLNEKIFGKNQELTADDMRFIQSAKPKAKDCPQCGKGTLSITEVRHLKFEVCSIEDCGFRQKIN